MDDVLEQALRLAATDPAARPAFYRALLDAEVVVIGRSNGTVDDDGRLSPGSHLSLAHWRAPDDTLFVPFFSSEARLHAAAPAETSILRLHARALFETARGSVLVLNPGAEVGKEFAPGEIDALLDHGVAHAADPHVVESARQVLLGQPAERPDALITAVSALLAGHANVRAAYLARMDDPSRPPPSLVIGLEGDGDLDAALREVGSVAADTAPRDTPVDLVEVRRGDDGLSDYFLRSVEPFYRRPAGGFGGRLRALFGG